MNDVRKLYELYYKDIYRFALYLSGNVSEAEDITAETFVRAIASKSNFVSETVKGYLLTIARNLYVEGIRRSKRGCTDGYENVEESLTHSLEETHELSTELQQTLSFLQNAAEIDRTALLFRVDGFSYREIAAVLNISVVSAKVKVHRLRTQLVEFSNE